MNFYKLFDSPFSRVEDVSPPLFFEGEKTSSLFSGSLFEGEEISSLFSPWFFEGEEGVSPSFFEGEEGVSPSFFEGKEGVSPSFFEEEEGVSPFFFEEFLIHLELNPTKPRPITIKILILVEES